jgi:hypothetical protein
MDESVLLPIFKQLGHGLCFAVGFGLQIVFIMTENDLLIFCFKSTKQGMVDSME